MAGFYRVTLQVRKCGDIGSFHRQTFPVIMAEPYPPFPPADMPRNVSKELFEAWQAQHSWESDATDKYEPLGGIITAERVDT